MRAFFYRSSYTLFGFFLGATPAFAQDLIGDGLQQTGTAAGYPLNGEAPKFKFESSLLIYANGLAVLMAALFMIRIVYAGWLWLSAKGNESQVEHAKDIILQGVIGISVIIGARIIVELVIDAIGAIALQA